MSSDWLFTCVSRFLKNNNPTDWKMKSQTISTEGVGSLEDGDVRATVNLFMYLGEVEMEHEGNKLGNSCITRGVSKNTRREIKGLKTHEA